MPSAAEITRRLQAGRAAPAAPPILRPGPDWSIVRPRVEPVRRAVPADVGGPEAVNPRLVSIFERLDAFLAAQRRPAPTTAGIVTLAPIAYTTKPFDVNLLQQTIRRPPAEVLLLNEGPAALTVTLQGAQYSMAPWDRHIFPCNGAATMHVEPVLLTSPLPSAPSSSLIVSIAPPGSAFPGVPTAASRQTASYAPQDILDQPTITTTLDKTYTLPTGTQSVAVHVIGNGVNPGDQLTAISQPSGNTIFSTLNAVTGQIYPAAVTIDDSQLEIQYTVAGGNGPAKIAVLAFFTNLVQFVQPNPTAQPAAWQAPTQTATMNGSNVNAGAAFTFISAVSGSQVFLHWMYLESNTGGAAANSWLVQDTVGGRLGANSNTNQQDANPAFNMDRKGLSVVSGRGVQAVNQQAGALSIYGAVDFARG